MSGEGVTSTPRSLICKVSPEGRGYTLQFPDQGEGHFHAKVIAPYIIPCSLGAALVTWQTAMWPRRPVSSPFYLPRLIAYSDRTSMETDWNWDQTGFYNITLRFWHCNLSSTCNHTLALDWPQSRSRSSCVWFSHKARHISTHRIFFSSLSLCIDPKAFAYYIIPCSLRPLWSRCTSLKKAAQRVLIHRVTFSTKIYRKTAFGPPFGKWTWILVLQALLPVITGTRTLSRWW